MGADGQPQIHLQAYIAMIDHGLDIQQALETPRFLSGRFALGEARDTLHIEGRFPPRRSPSWSGAAIWSIAGVTGTRWRAMPTASPSIRRAAAGGGADPRSDGAAIGY